MKNRRDLNRILMLLLFVIAYSVTNAQSAGSQTSTKKVYRWQKRSAHNISSSEGQSYNNLPQVDYTPDNNIDEWSAAKELKSFAAKQNSKRIIIRTILEVDEQGVIRSTKVLSTNNKSVADELSKLLLNTKVSGPSYINNRAVTADIPCFFTINNQKIDIL